MTVIRSASNQNGLEINGRGRALTLAVSRRVVADKSDRESVFIMNSGDISLTTTGAYNGILYYSHNDTTHFHIEQIILSSDVAVKWRIFRNPTTGTLISSGTTFDPPNLNFNATQSLDGTAVYGADALTVTNGDEIFDFNEVAGSKHDDINGGIRMSKSNSIAIACQPSAAADVSVQIIGYLEDEDEE